MDNKIIRVICGLINRFTTHFTTNNQIGKSTVKQLNNHI
jgi:hypothetical protein